jgi:hypothetical protein
MAALSEPGLLLIRRAWDRDKKRLKAQITVDEVRKLGGFFGLSATSANSAASLAFPRQMVAAVSSLSTALTT